VYGGLDNVLSDGDLKLTTYPIPFQFIDGTLLTDEFYLSRRTAKRALYQRAKVITPPQALLP
jgi:hypothetical protein